MVGWKIGQTKKNAAPIAPLLLLCFLWSLSSLRSDLLPQFPTIANQGLLYVRQALPLAMLAIAASLLALVRRSEWPRGEVLRDRYSSALGLLIAKEDEPKVTGSSLKLDFS